MLRSTNPPFAAVAAALSLAVIACATTPSEVETPPPVECPEPEVVAAPETAPETAADASAMLVLDGTPEIPQAMRDRLNQYLNTRSASLSDLSDDGTDVLVNTRFAETAQLHRVDDPMGARRQLTFFEEPVRGGIFVPGQPDTVLYSSDVGGTEEYQLFLLDLKTGRSTALTPTGVRAGGAELSDDGRFLAYSRNVLGEPDTNVWVSRGTDPDTAHPVVDAEGYFYPLDFSPDGRRLLVGRYISISESEVWLVELDDNGERVGEMRKVTPDTPTSNPSAMFAGNSDAILLASDLDDQEFINLYYYPLPDAGGADLKSYRMTDDIDWNVEDFDLAPDGRTVAFVVNEGGISRVYLHDLDSGAQRPLDVVPAGIVSDLMFADAAPVLGFSFASATSSGDVFTVTPGIGGAADTLTRWTDSEMGGLDPSAFAEPELIATTSFDGLEIPAFYYRPEGEGPFPVVINIHGGPEGQYRPWFSPTSQFMSTELGVAVLAPNVRGSDGYGKTYLALDNGYKREDSVKDIGALLDWIAARPELDANRVGVLGGSYGGYMVLASLMHYSDRIRAGVDVVGISNFVTFLENTREYRQDLRRVEYGDERDPEMRKFLLSISPTENVDRIQSALFVAQGANDPRVPASEAEQIVEAVRASGRDVWYMLALNEGHGFSRKENRDTFSLLTLMFFAQHLEVD